MALIDDTQLNALADSILNGVSYLTAAGKAASKPVLKSYLEKVMQYVVTNAEVKNVETKLDQVTPGLGMVAGINPVLDTTVTPVKETAAQTNEGTVE